VGGMFAIGHVVAATIDNKQGGCCGWAEELLLVLELCFHQGQIGGGKQGGRCHLGGQR
jgi:hypothetical protein